MAIATAPLAPANAELIAFAEVVTALASKGFTSEQINALFDTPTIAETPAPMPVTVVKPTKVAQTKPVAKRTPARKAADVQAAPNMRLTTDGRMMNAENGTATKNQITRNIAFAEKHGFIVEDFASFSMADASDWYADAKSAL